MDRNNDSVLRTPSGTNVQVAGERLLSEFRSDSVVRDEESRDDNLNGCSVAAPGARFAFFFFMSVSMAMGMPSCFLAVS